MLGQLSGERPTNDGVRVAVLYACSDVRQLTFTMNVLLEFTVRDHLLPLAIERP